MAWYRIQTRLSFAIQTMEGEEGTDMGLWCPFMNTTAKINVKITTGGNNDMSHNRGGKSKGQVRLIDLFGGKKITCSHKKIILLFQWKKNILF